MIYADPFMDYMEEGLKNTEPDRIRKNLLAMPEIADAIKVPFIGVRHRGKIADNVMPDSREYFITPTVIWLMELEEGSRENGILKPYKYQIGKKPPSYLYELEPRAKQPPLFRLESPADGKTEEEFGIPLKPEERGRLKEAMLLLWNWLKGKRWRPEVSS